jgi:outer membrane protein assembly factor BamB
VSFGRRICWLCLAAVSASVLATGCGDSGAGNRAVATAEARPHGPEWGAPDADLENTRRLDSRIDASNVATLREAWRVYPGDWGGVQTQMASDGATVYVPVNNLYAIFRGQTLPEQQDPLEGTGELVALDVATGRVRWERRLPHGVYGGATITNDLLLTTTYEGTVWALERERGEVVWRAALPAGSIAPVVVSGDTLLSAGGIPVAAGRRREIVAYRLSG